MLRTILLTLVLFSINLCAQNISRYEKCWAIKHCFIAKKAFKLTKQVRLTVDSLKKDTILIGTGKQDQIDAFRHSFWMAYLVQHFKVKKVKKLGEAHEKANYKLMQKNMKEDGVIPDSLGITMDLFNNEVGLKMSSKNKRVSYNRLKKIIIKAIQRGDMKVLLQDKNGNYYDCNRKLLIQENHKDWKQKKCLAPSNHIVTK